MNRVYIYNGSFNELLNLIAYLLKSQIKPDNIHDETYNANLFDYVINLDLPNKKDIISKFHDYFGSYNMHLVYYVYLSSVQNKELIIFYYLLNYFKYRENLPKMRNLKCVSEVLRISKQVGNEAHRFKGFLRFKELKNHVLYATIAPDNNILEIISCHFQKRLKNEYWLIKDEKRQIISVYNKKNFYIVSTNDFNLKDLALDDKEKEIEKLWVTFYNTIFIKERKNERCRMNFMPKKYWHNILEMSDNDEESY